MSSGAKNIEFLILLFVGERLYKTGLFFAQYLCLQPSLSKNWPSRRRKTILMTMFMLCRFQGNSSNPASFKIVVEDGTALYVGGM